MSRYIDADALCEALMTRWNTADKNAEKLISEVMADIVTPIVVSMPTADVVEVVHGEWIEIDKRGKNVQCSKCGNTLDLRGVNTGRGDANYCPNCGAKMGSNDVIPFNARWEIDERELGGYDS